MSARRSGTLGLAGRIAIVLLGPIAVTLALYGYFAHRARERVLLAEASLELRDHATLVETAAFDAADSERMQRRLQRMTRADRVIGIAVFDRSGRAVMVTEALRPATSGLKDLTARAAEQGTELEEGLTLPNGHPSLARTVVLRLRDGTELYAVVARDMRYVSALVRELDEALLLAGSVLLVLTAVAVVLVCRITVGRPARSLVHAVERVAGGDLAITVEEKGAEELARLAAAINHMSRSLREARATVEREESARTGAERKLQHARALAAVGQVAASIAHEVGSPLNVILGRARRAASLRDCPERIRTELDTIAAQSERISRTVSGLLAVARPARAERVSADARRTAAEVLDLLQPECRKRGIALMRPDAGGPPARVGVASDQLFQVLFNLCMNAIEAQPHGGALSVRVAARGAEEGVIPRVDIEVEDAGSGVPEDVAPRIFEPFFTTKGDRGGTGLGLDIASGIVREGGGTLELLPGASGARFRVSLPATSDDRPRRDSTHEGALAHAEGRS